MRLRLLVPTLAAGALAFGLAAPVSAQSGPSDAGADYATDAEGRVFGDAMPQMPVEAPQVHAMGHHAMPPQPAEDAAAQREQWEQDRLAWLDECRERMDYRRDRRGRDRDSGLGGALIGGVAGGLIGNRVAGRHDRTVGTVLGGVAGAAIGAAIDRSDNAGNREERRSAYRGDYCEQYFDYYTRGGQSAYGYGQVMMVPVMMMQHQQQQPCVETVVTEEWVQARRPHRHRYVAPRPRPRPAPVVHDKRIRM